MDKKLVDLLSTPLRKMMREREKLQELLYTYSDIIENANNYSSNITLEDYNVAKRDFEYASKRIEELDIRIDQMSLAREIVMDYKGY